MGGAGFLTVNEESSGIIDVSDILDLGDGKDKVKTKKHK